MARLSLRRSRPAASSTPARLPRQGPLVASGTRIDASDKRQIAAYRRRQQTSDWQNPAWVFNAIVPLLGFGHDYVRDSMSRVRPYPAFMSDDSDEGPVPLTKDTEPEPGLAELCDAICQRLEPFPYFMGRSAFLNDISGECHVAIVPDDGEEDGERVRVLSNKELTAEGDAWRIKEHPGDNEGILIPGGAPFWRIWQNDPEWEVLPFSHMVRLNPVAERYLTLARLVKAFGLSQLATTGKLIAIADEFTLETPSGHGEADTGDAGDGEGLGDTFFEDFMDAGAQAILDPESAEAVMNLVIRGPRELIKDGVNVIDISRTMEDVMIRLRAEAMEEMATGINLPREVLLGVGGTNHWNAEQIKEQAWLNHLEPRAYNVLAATTNAFYRPVLRSNDIDPDIIRRCLLWYDPTWFLGMPDKAESADFGYTNYLLSGEAWRAAKNYSDDDAPGQDEIDARVKIRQEEQVRVTIREDDTTGSTTAPPTQLPDSTPLADPPGEKPPVPDQTDKTAPDAPPLKGKKVPAPKSTGGKKRTASGVPDLLGTLGDRHVVIERDTRTRLHQAADSIMARAMERAGMKVRSKLLSGKGQSAARDAFTVRINAVAAAEIPALVGREGVESFGLDDQKLLDGALGDLEGRYRTLVRRAQHAAARTATKAAGVAEFDYDQLDARTADDRDAGWAVLSAGLLGLASTLIYDPHPEAPPVGEYDGASLVPPGLVRAALERAGGGTIGTTKDVRGADVPELQTANDATTDPTGGATAGPTMLDEFADQLGISTDGYEWVYGDAPRSREFEPHLDLDGATFATFEDDVLLNPGDWPDYDHLFPGDHNGCGCDVSISYTQAGETTSLEPGLGVDQQTPLTRTEKADALDAPRRPRGGA